MASTRAIEPPVSGEREAELVAAEAARAARQGAPNVSLWEPRAVPGVYGCIVAVSAEMATLGIAKDSRNVQQGYAFRGIDAVMNALAPLLAKHRLVILPRFLSRDVAERQTQKGGSLFYVTVEAEFDFVCAADGSTHTVRMFGEAMDSADKATNKAMSAAYKYAAFQTFCIPTEGEDTDETTHELAAPAAAPHTLPVTRGGIPSAPNVGGSGTLSAPAPRAAIPAVSEERENTVAAPVGERAALSTRPDPPYGYVYIDEYHFKDGWHDVRVGRTKYSTKTDVGFIAGDSAKAGCPVKINSTVKNAAKGEHWLNGVEKWSGSDARL